MEKNSRELHEIIVTAEIKTAKALKSVSSKITFSFQSCVNILCETYSFIIFSV